MNREEALNKIGELVVYARAQGLDEAFTEAFEILSAECEDAISRETVLNAIKKVCFSKEQRLVDFRVSQGSNGQRDFIIKFIESLHPVAPKQNDVLDKIMAELISLPYQRLLNINGYSLLNIVIDIIDSYKTESERSENE